MPDGELMPAEANLAGLQREWGPLSRRAINALSRAGVIPERLGTLTDWHLRRMRGIGPGVLAEIRTVYPGLAKDGDGSA